MKLKYIREYPTVFRNYGIKGLVRLLINIPYRHYLSKNVRFIERKVNNYRMLLDLDDRGISRELFMHGTREIEHIMFLKEELRPGSVVLDIGANIGYYSIMMGLMVGRQGKVYALEPALPNYQLLSANIKLNGLENVVEMFNVGISNETGTGKFYLSKKSNWHTFYPKVHTGEITESLVNAKPVEVPVFTVHDFIKTRPGVELIRMDIEGFEVEVLDSLIPDALQGRFMPKILFEVHTSRYDDREHDMRRCLAGLFDAGYYVKKLASHITADRHIRAFRVKGYKPVRVIKSDGVKREIFDNIANKDAISYICDTGLVRTVLLDFKTK